MIDCMLGDGLRPQTPAAPFPYETKEVAIRNEVAGIKLSGTITIPLGNGPFPAIRLIAGSGPMDRDETLYGHKPFWLIADFLSRCGFVVLRVDRRGVGSSTGDFSQASGLDFAADVAPTVSYLRNHPKVDPAKVGLIGHSEGSNIACMVAANDPKVAFCILLAGPGMSGEEIVYEQCSLLMAAKGFSAEIIADEKRRLGSRFAIVKSQPDPALAAVLLNELISRELVVNPSPTDRNVSFTGYPIEEQVASINGPWFRYFLVHDPMEHLEKISAPIFAITGDKDLQVRSTTNLARMQMALSKGGNQDFTLVELKGINHQLQPCQTGAPEEYEKIPITIASEVLDLIVQWLSMRFVIN